MRTRSDQLEHPHNPEGPEDCHRGCKFLSKVELVHNDTYVRGKHYQHIKNVPVVMEVDPAKSYELQNHFNVEDECKEVVDVFSKLDEFIRHLVVLYSHHYRVEDDEEGNRVGKV